MKLEQTLAALEKAGKPNTVKIYARHGVRGACYGVPYAAIGALTKKIKQDHALALGLFKTGNHDARVLACKIADPQLLSEREARAWLAATSNYVITDAVAGVIARGPGWRALAEALIEEKGEWASAAGWTVFAIRALDGSVAPERAQALLGRIERTIRHAPNRTRYAMNGALIAFATLEGVKADALASARRIGAVEVDHGQTGCVTPDAVPYIQKMGERRGATETARPRATRAAPAKRTRRRSS